VDRPSSLNSNLIRSRSLVAILLIAARTRGRTRLQLADLGVRDALRVDSAIEGLYLTGQDVVLPGIAGAWTGALVTAARILGLTGLLRMLVSRV
jgi:hypothetical protein